MMIIIDYYYTQSDTKKFALDVGQYRVIDFADIDINIMTQNIGDIDISPTMWRSGSCAAGKPGIPWRAT